MIKYAKKYQSGRSAQPAPADLWCWSNHRSAHMAVLVMGWMIGIQPTQKASRGAPASSYQNALGSQVSQLLMPPAAAEGSVRQTIFSRLPDRRTSAAFSALMSVHLQSARVSR